MTAEKQSIKDQTTMSSNNKLPSHLNGLNESSTAAVRNTDREQESVAAEDEVDSSSKLSSKKNRGSGMDTTMYSLVPLSPLLSAVANVPPQCCIRQRHNMKECDDDEINDTEEETISLDCDDDDEIDEIEDDYALALHKKHVRFNLWQNKAHDDTLRCAEECHETWFSSQDYHASKQDIRDIVWAVTAQEKFQQQQQQQEDGNNGAPGFSSFSARLQSLLEVASAVNYLEPDASALANQMHNELASLYHTTSDNGDCDDNSNDDLEDLIGLESYLCPFLKLESMKHRCTLQNIVSRIREEQDDKGLVELQECCCTVSQDLVLLGQLLAKARLLMA